MRKLHDASNTAESKGVLVPGNKISCYCLNTFLQISFESNTPVRFFLRCLYLSLKSILGRWKHCGVKYVKIMADQFGSRHGGVQTCGWGALLPPPPYRLSYSLSTRGGDPAALSPMLCDSYHCQCLLLPGLLLQRPSDMGKNLSSSSSSSSPG